MYDNYPVGVDTPNAPWNQEEVPVRTFNVLCSQTLSKEVDVKTNDYILENLEKDEDGNVNQNIDTSDTNWINAYGIEHYTPQELILIFSYVLNLMLADKNYYYLKKGKLLELIEECKDWINDETVIDGPI